MTTPASPVLVSLTDFQRLLGGQAADANTDDLLLYLLTADEMVEKVVGPLVEPIPARWRMAARIIAEHLWDHWQGAVPVPYQSGTDTDVGSGTFGFAMPRAASELLKTEAAQGLGPLFSFPPAIAWPL